MANNFQDNFEDMTDWCKKYPGGQDVYLSMVRNL